MPHGRPWTDTECRYLRTFYAKKNLVLMAIDLNRTEAAICSKRRAMKLPKGVPDWTEQQKQMLRELWPVHSRSEIAKMMGKTLNSISGASFRAGLKR